VTDVDVHGWARAARRRSATLRPGRDTSMAMPRMWKLRLPTLPPREASIALVAGER
jgi:hypothetical protein